MTAAVPRTFAIRTHGCQMNVHDSERLAGVLVEAGWEPAPSDAAPEDADLVVFNTCAVRENADNKLYGQLGRLAPTKAARPDQQIAVGGCLAQKDRETVTKRAPWVDVVFGTHNVGSLPRCSTARGTTARRRSRSSRRSRRSRRTCRPAASPPTRAGCRSPSAATTPAPSASSPRCAARRSTADPGEVLGEVEALVAEGVLEVTLLGQNVNAYGVDFDDRASGRTAFADLLRACGAIEGLERVRFTSPHPRDFTSDVITAMAETPNVCPQLHMPLQSGSDRVLKAMRRSYRARRYLEIVDEVRDAMPDAALTTDIIVGFPGETEEDFQGTLDVVRRSRFSQAFTFQYSPRPGTPAATLGDQVPKAVVQDRYDRLVALQEEMSLAGNREQVGRELELLVASGEGRKDSATRRMSGRARDGRLVHFTPTGPALSGDVRPGDVVTVRATYGAPHHVVADGDVLTHRRTRAGDAHEAGTRPTTPRVTLGLPSIGRPETTPEPVSAACGVGSPSA